MSVSERRQREREERRNHILDAAERVFLERGFDETTMDDLAGEAELAKGTLYLYFKNKEDLLADLLVRRRSPLLQRFGEAAADASHGLDHVRRLIEAQLESFAGDPPQFRRFFLHRMVDGPPASSDAPGVEAHSRHVRRVISSFLQAIERGQSDGSIRTDLDPHALTAHIWGGTVGTLLMQMHVPRMRERLGHTIDPDTLSKMFVSMTIDAIRTPCRHPEEATA